MIPPQIRMHNRNMRRFVTAFVLACLAFVGGCDEQNPQPQSQSKTRIRVGWQTGWATQGQLAQVLKRTNILERYGLAGDFEGFSYGGPLNEAALAGEVDVIFTADQPAATLIARGAKWKIVARLIDFRACVIVPPASPAKTIKGLRGKTIAIPFGSGTHRIALSMLKNAGLVPDVDVKLRNLDILEQSALAQTASGGRWGEVDAMASWDPTVALLESKKLARVLKFRRALSVVVMSEDFLKENPEAAVRFLKSYRLAYAYYATHAQQANSWFIEETKTQVPAGVLDAAAAFERNMKAKTVTDIRIGLSDAEIAQVQEGADFGLAQKLTTRSPNIREAINQSFLNSAATTPELLSLGDVKAKTTLPIDYAKLVALAGNPFPTSEQHGRSLATARPEALASGSKREKPPVPYQFTRTVMAGSLRCIDADVVTDDGPGTDPTNYGAASDSDLRAIAYFSWHNERKLFITRRVFPIYFDFFSLSYVDEGWGALGELLQDMERTDFQKKRFTKVANVFANHRFLPFLKEAHRLNYEAAFVIPFFKPHGRPSHETLPRQTCRGPWSFTSATAKAMPPGTSDSPSARRVADFSSAFSKLVSLNEDKIQTPVPRTKNVLKGNTWNYWAAAKQHSAGLVFAELRLGIIGDKEKVALGVQSALSGGDFVCLRDTTCHRLHG